MFWRKRRRAPAALTFKDGQAAIEHASKFMDCELAEGRMLPAVVLDATKEFRTSTAVKIRPDGIQQAVLRVSGRPGPFMTLAETSSAAGPLLRPGDLVAWCAVHYEAGLAKDAGEPRMGWVGVIVGKLDLSWTPEAGWVGAERFAR